MATEIFPKCWNHYGECLDLNEQDLDIGKKIKPKNNRNVVGVVKTGTLDECMMVGWSNTKCLRKINKTLIT